jgi:hypothetical protein
MGEIAITLVQQPEWAKGPARIEGQEVVLDESRAERYWFYESEQAELMAFDLAAMAFYRSGRDPQQAKAFVRRYGLLWHGADKLGSGECRETLDDWWLAAEKLSSVLYVSVGLGEAMREGSAAPIRRFFEGLGMGPILEHVASRFDAPPDETYIMAATTIAARLLNQGLEGGRWGMVTARPGELQLAYYPTSLVAAAYANIATLVAAKAEFKECPGCGRIFQPKSGKQKYHEPGCATRTRQLRWKRGKSENSR